MTGLGPQVRLFALLALLVPFFLGLESLVRESVPQIEVRFVAPDAQAAAPAPAERVVERVVYVPIEKTETAPLRERPSSGLQQAGGRSAEAAKLSGMDTVVAAAAPIQAVSDQARLHVDAEQPEAETVGLEAASVGEPVDEPTIHMGVVAAVTPIAAPVVAAAPPARPVAAPARVVVAPVVAESDPVEDEETVVDEAAGEEPAEAEPVVAEAEQPEATEDVTEIQVVETMLDGGSQTTRVVSYRIPVHPSTTSEPEQAAEPQAAEEPAGVEEEAAAEEEPAGVGEEPEAVEDEPMGALEGQAAAEDEPVAVAEVDEAPAWDEAEDPERIAESEPVDLTDEAAAVSNVSVTVVVTEQGQ